MYVLKVQVTSLERRLCYKDEELMRMRAEYKLVADQLAEVQAAVVTANAEQQVTGCALMYCFSPGQACDKSALHFTTSLLSYSCVFSFEVHVIDCNT